LMFRSISPMRDLHKDTLRESIIQGLTGLTGATHVNYTDVDW